VRAAACALDGTTFKLIAWRATSADGPAGEEREGFSISSGNESPATKKEKEKNSYALE